MRYPKIETLFERDMEGNKGAGGMWPVIPEKIKREEFKIPNRWLVTEKLDGMNIRIIASRDTVTFRGRSDNAQLPPMLLDWLNEHITVDHLNSTFFDGETDDTEEVILFGEGYGKQIQKGGHLYRDESLGPNFRLFDVHVMANSGNWWLNWDNIEDIASKMQVDTVPVLYKEATLETAISCVNHPMYSHTAVAERPEDDKWREHEGIVARTEPLLFDRRGSRVMWKLKGIDYGRSTAAMSKHISS